MPDLYIYFIYKTGPFIIHYGANLTKFFRPKLVCTQLAYTLLKHENMI